LSACRLAGLVDEGMHYYTSMITIYMILAKLEHDPAWSTLLVMSIYSLYNFCKIGTLPLHGSPCWRCWPSTGGREYDGDVVCKPQGCMEGFVLAAFGSL
jgi:hypothetical protein